MANAWFRMYAEFATDPKVQMLSEADQRRYLMLLCLRCANGDVTLHETEVAFQLRISNEQWAETKAVLLAKGLIDEACQPTAWDKRQYVSDSSAARVAAHRQRKKQACNVTVTPPDTDTDTDTEEKASTPVVPSEPPKPAAGAPGTAAATVVAQPKPKAKRKTALPDPFLLTTEMARWARERSPAANLSLETEKFCNHWRGKGETRADWVATWRTWMLNAQTYAQRATLARQPAAGPDFESLDWIHEDLGI